MKHILLIIIIILIIPYYSFSNEYIIIRVCKAVAGCPVNVDTGECPTCIHEKKKVKKYKLLNKKIVRIKIPSFINCDLCIGFFNKWR